MQARKQNAYQNVLTQSIQCQWRQKCTSTCVDPIHPVSVSTKKVSQLVLTKSSHVSTDCKYIATCVKQIPPMPATTQNVFQRVLNNPLPCQCQHGNTKYILTYVDQTPPMTARTQNVYQIYLTKPLPRQWHKLHLIMCWLNPSHASEDTEWNSTCKANEDKKNDINIFWPR